MRQKLLLWAQKREKHLSALAMIAGFVTDNLFFTRVDLVQTQVLLGVYAAACFIAIPLLHSIEIRRERGGRDVRWRVLLPFVTQFALGGFWSAFVIFYGRSATLGVSWPFLTLLLLVFLGSEYFHHYHARLVFTSVLFFFALYSCAVFVLPIYTHSIGTVTFLESGGVAVGIFIIFTIVLRVLARQRFYQDVWRIRAGALIVLVLMNVFYFANILPPLPLSATAAGVYHNVQHVPGEYLGTQEAAQSWQVRYLGFAPTLHLLPGDTVYAYSSVFAPTALTTNVVHRWFWYDAEQKEWVQESAVSYSIVGGRDGGYRGYTLQTIQNAGDWRVDIETSDGRLIARLPFIAEIGTTTPTEETISLP